MYVTVFDSLIEFVFRRVLDSEGGPLHTQNACRMYDAGRTTVTELIWLDFQGEVNNDIFEERNKDHKRIRKKCVFDELNSHQGKSHDICDSDSDSQ